jgi:hypothetical protein
VAIYESDESDKGTIMTRTTAVAMVLALTLVGGGCGKRRAADADEGTGPAPSGEKLRDKGDDVKVKPVKPKDPMRELVAGADVTTTAAKLFGDYQTNAVAADQKYKGKTLCVVGVVAKIDTDIMGRGVVFLVGGSGQLDNVVCYFDKSHKGDVANLTMRDSVAVVGKCDGKRLTQVSVTGCRLVASGTSGDDVLNKLDAIKAGN